MLQCHTHQDCINHAIENAEEICQRSGIRLTKLRKRILELVWDAHKPIKAYDLLARFQQEDPAAKPSTIYRSLDFLQDNGLVHKIHCLNAYMGCSDPEHKNPYFLLICMECSEISEATSDPWTNFLDDITSKHHFKHSNMTVEIEGICQKCQHKMDS